MRKILLACLMIASAMAMVGCSTRYTITDASPSGAVKLERNQSIYIAVPKDGMYGDKVYSGSGQQAVAALQNAITQYASIIAVGSQHEDAVSALESGAAKKARYVFVPVITNWVHRKAAWSGRSSGVSLTITVYDLAREGEDKRVVQKDLRVQGRNATLVSQHPGKILNPLLIRFAKEVF